MSDRREKSVTGEKLMMASSSEAEQAAIKQRGRRELQTIEIETYENEDPEGGPWVHRKNLIHIIPFCKVLRQLYVFFTRKSLEARIKTNFLLQGLLSQKQFLAMILLTWICLVPAKKHLLHSLSVQENMEPVTQ